MNTSKDSSLRQSFVLTEEDAAKLFNALTEFGQNVKIEIKCSDGLNRNMGTIEELLAFENPRAREIQELTLYARSPDFDRSARLKFLVAGFSTMWLSIEGPEEAVIKLNSFIEELLPNMKPWYASIAKLDFTLVALSMLGIFFVGLMLFAATGLIPNTKSEPDLKTTAVANLMLIVIIGVPLVLGFVLNRWRKTLFPIGVFAIGQGRKRHADKEWIRSTVIVGFFVSLAAGVVVLLLSR